MPLYIFQHKDSHKIEEVFFHMDDEKIYNGKDGKEIGKWLRVWTKPNAAFDSVPVDAFSSKDFNRVTNKGGKIGDLWDRSAELSEKRKEKEGVDPFKEGFYKEYRKKHKNNAHPEEKREKSKKVLEDSGVVVKWED